ncbi:MAG: NAD(P)H-dependent oxidoreductase [Pseudomonadota bacterium]
MGPTGIAVRAMRLLVVHCHPDPQSFGAAVRDRVLAGASRAGHEVDLMDLHAEGFDPVMSCEERRGYHTPVENERPVAAHIARLRAAEGLIFVYPTWWYGQPAMLKGWLDRVFVPGVAFEMPLPGQPIRGGLKNIRLVGAISTLGSPWWWWTFAMRAPGRRILLTGVRAICNPRARTFWLALHGMDSATDAQRTRFLDRVEARVARLS